ncbi:MAG: hypothetical protein LBU46_01980 [Candidatus Accumulibacter sp.]|nr:hypothetical protein [Accumulibacter sp.]
MSQTSYLAVVLEGGQVQSVILQEWPARIPQPRVVVVDYDIECADEEDLTHFSIGAVPMIALCHSEIPDVYETFKRALSPKAVLEALGEPVDCGGIDPHENRLKTEVEPSLTDSLTGYLRQDPARREEVRNFPDWPRMARRELDRRSARLLEVLPDDALDAIARGEIDLAGLAGKIPG